LGKNAIYHKKYIGGNESARRHCEGMMIIKNAPAAADAFFKV